MAKIKLFVCIGWIIGVFGIFFTQRPIPVKAYEIELNSVIAKPDLKEVEKFNVLILGRFLTEPGFGSARIQPIPPYSKHIETFYPKNELEKTAVNNFEQNDWKVGLYLFGRKANRKIKNGVEQKEFLIEYRFKQPVIITKNIKEREELSNSNRMLKQVKEAFLLFQGDQENEKSFEFKIGKWWYYAKPVRAVNQSCVQCHTDYVVLKKLDDGKYQFRQRKVGDVNGVLVYAFQKVKK